VDKFTNITIEGNEKAVRIGTNVVQGDVVLAWFNTEEISASNSVSIVDLSGGIPENSITTLSTNAPILTYADELGFLRKFDGSYTFPTNNMTISNLFLGSPTSSRRYLESELDAKDFIHYHYTSRYFTAAPAGIPLLSLKDFAPQRNADFLKIKVLNEYNSEYIDPVTGKKKYRILLEPFNVEGNLANFEIPYKIIVLLDHTKPVNLKLVYDKIETDDEGTLINQEIQYSETINAVPYFSEIPEESFVMDRNYSRENNFSIKKINQKYSDLFSNYLSDSGYQVITPTRGISDYRTFEVFNWRLVARSRKNINLDQLNYGQEIDSSGNIISKKVKAGVLYSSKDGVINNSLINPYIFYRLEKSPFNLAKYTIINPLHENSTFSIDSEIDIFPQPIAKNTASYWRVNIDEVNDLSQFDILAWSPSSDITAEQQSKITAFMKKSGTLILDMSISGANASGISPQLSLASSNISSQSIAMTGSSVVIDPTKNGGWTLVNQVFEKPYYGIYGSNFITTNSTYKTYKYFNSTGTINSFLKSGSTSTTQQNIGIVIDYPNSGDALARGNVVAMTFPLMSYCNSVYDIASSEKVVDSNYGEIHYTGSLDSISTGGSVYPGILEGPFKFLYNCMSYALYCRAQATREIDIRSSLFNFITRWDSSWAMDQNALFDDEKAKYFTRVALTSSNEVHARDLTGTSPTLFDFYKKAFSEYLPAAQQEVLSNLNPEDIEFFIEVTNPDIKIINGVIVDPEDFAEGENISSAYTLYKLSESNNKLYAYTDVESPKLTIPSDLGPYVIIDKSISSSSTRVLTNLLGDPLNQFKTYSFNLRSSYNYARATDKPLFFNVNFTYSSQIKMYGIINTTERRLVSGGTPGTPGGTGDPYPGELRCLRLTSAADSRIGAFGGTNKSTESGNVFPFTRDLFVGNSTIEWKDGTRGEYVKYIQYVFSLDGYYTKSIDGAYGPITRDAAIAFQRANSQRYDNGTVDSETKYFLSKRWKRASSTQRESFYAAHSGAAAFAREALNTVEVNEIGEKNYDKITFTGFAGPSVASDIIFFEIPSSFITVDKVSVIGTGGPPFNDYRVSDYGYTSFFTTDVFAAYPNWYTINRQLSGNIINIDFPGGISQSSVKGFWVNIIGNSVGYGYGEGFGIGNITATGMIRGDYVPGTPGTDPVYEDVSVQKQVLITMDVTTAASASNITSSAPFTKTYATNNIDRPTSYVTKVSWTGVDGTSQSQTFNPNTYYLNDSTLYKFGNLELKFSDPLNSVALTSASITQIKDTSNNAITSSPAPLSLIRSGNRIDIETSAIYYSGSQVINVNKDLTEYYLKKIDGTFLPDSRKNISVLDGVLLLCKQDGSPYGLVTSSEINTAISGISSFTDEEIDMRYGYFFVRDIDGDQEGMIYGFYDIAQKEFLGKTLYYLDYIARGVSNIFIGVCAIDADGNIQNRNEYIGPKVDTTFKPVNVPVKLIAPIYSMRYNSTSALQVNSLDQDRSKFDTWELPITMGSFWKNITLSKNINWTDWKSKYTGQQMQSHYSTMDKLPVVWSDIYGYGHYDITDEHPKLVSEKKIKVKRAPILVWNYPSTYQNSVSGLIKEIVKVYIRSSISSDWEEVPYISIRDINCETGIIEFKSRIVPSDNRLIKVSYTTPNKNILLKQINGDAIPLNPVLNKDIIRFGRPLHIYLLPRKIYKSTDPSNLSSNLEKVKDYQCISPVNFTYDSSIFDSRSPNYDPFALQIAIVYVFNNPYKTKPAISDLRLRGGGVKPDVEIVDARKEILNYTSYWDVYPPEGTAYNKGGYIIVRIPDEVRDNFVDEKEIYDIISNNLTAGVVFELQDMDGNTW
jgi:hypothetical protein